MQNSQNLNLIEGRMYRILFFKETYQKKEISRQEGQHLIGGLLLSFFLLRITFKIFMLI